MHYVCPMHCGRCSYRFRIKRFGGETVRCPKCGNEQIHVPQLTVWQKLKNLPTWLVIFIVTQIVVVIGGTALIVFVGREILKAIYPPFWPA